MEERLLDTEIPSRGYENLTKEERNAFYNLKDDTNIIMKGSDKGSIVVVCDTQEYLRESYKQLEDKEVHERVPNDSSVLVNSIMKVFEKMHLQADWLKDTLNYFLVQDSKFARFYLLQKINKRLHDEPVRPVIWKCEIQLHPHDCHLQPVFQEVNHTLKIPINF